MKKALFLCVTLLLSVFAFAGCGSKDVTIDVNKMADAIKDGISFEDEMNETKDSIFYKTYTEISKDDVVAQKTYLSTKATAEEIAVVECKDTDAAEKVKSAFETRVKDQTETYKSYVPAEVDRLDKAVVEVKGKYAILVVTKDDSKAKEIIDDNAK